MKIAVVGAGWAGLSAAVAARRAGHEVTLWESSRTLGGRARALVCTLPNGSTATLDNGQHILIGAYRETLQLMRDVGVDPEQALLRLPLALVFADGSGVRFTHSPAPLDAALGIARARGWSISDKLSLLRCALHWRLNRFQCAPEQSVNDVCARLTARVMADLIEPLCVSALNTPAPEASGAVFLRVLRDALFAQSGGSNLLLPRVDLSSLMPDAAARWLRQHGAEVRIGARMRQLESVGARWRVDGGVFDQVLLASAAADTLHILQASLPSFAQASAQSASTWCARARGLRFRAITTVYAWGRDARLAQPMLALRSQAGAASPAQFAFDRHQLGGAAGLLAFVVSDSATERDALQAQVLTQARMQLGLELQALQTVVEKRATFACTPALQRPPMFIAPGLLACADYVDGPYPATLEGAVRAGSAAVRMLNTQ